MIRGVKLNKLLEQSVNSGQGVHGYTRQFRELLGITEGRFGESVLDLSQRQLHPHDFSFAEIAHAFLGREYQSRVKEVAPARAYGRLMEADGHVVKASHFANINAFSDTVAGLVEAMVLEAYQSPEFIGDNFVTVVDRRVNGGAMIGVMNDGGEGEDLALGDPYPMVGLKETRVEIPENIRRGVGIQVDEFTFIYDRTDKVRDAAQAAGYSTKRRREIEIADQVMGITNNYQRDGVSSNTYLAAAGEAPNDYINSAAIGLENWTDIDEALDVMRANSDPGTGFEIAIPRERLTLLVHATKQMLTSTIVKAVTLEQRTASATEIRVGPNPLPPLNLVASDIWSRRADSALGGTANAVLDWWLGDFPKAFGYSQVIPFGMNEAQLSSEDQRRDIVAIWIAREYGVPFTKEPRFVFYSNPQ